MLKNSSSHHNRDNYKKNSFPPLSWAECRSRGWDSLDILLVTGDAYVDHPSFGIAIIYRLLENYDYRVAILSQPRYDSNSDFAQFPTPKIFCGITAGNLDSIVANYSANGKVRDRDSYSPHGNPWRENQRGKQNRLRPDRASIVYTNLAKSTFDCPIVLGGIEASLRRFVHYDYKQEKLRASILTDSKADILVYGMGERPILEIAKKYTQQECPTNINSTCIKLTCNQKDKLYPGNTTNRELLYLPTLNEIQKNPDLFLEAELAIDKHSRRNTRQLVLQKQQAHWVLQYPSAKPLKEKELDSIYSLPFTRKTHKSQPRVPAFAMIKDSVTIVRGCSGNCSFCAITRHQGAQITSRSINSIISECKQLAASDSFTGTISDLGGPTANLYGVRCKIGTCNKKDCLYPKLCPNLEIDEEKFLELLKKVSGLAKVKHLFISSGLRMALLLQTPKLHEKIITSHTPGILKIAPEHTNREVLALMHKEEHELLIKFIAKSQEIAKRHGQKINISPYIITSHPGSETRHTKSLAADLKKLGLQVYAFQDFTPTPGTLSTAMYVAEKSAIDKKKIFVAKNNSKRTAQRKIIERELLQQSKVKTRQTGNHNYPRKK